MLFYNTFLFVKFEFEFFSQAQLTQTLPKQLFPSLDLSRCLVALNRHTVLHHRATMLIVKIAENFMLVTMVELFQCGVHWV